MTDNRDGTGGQEELLAPPRPLRTRRAWNALAVLAVTAAVVVVVVNRNSGGRPRADQTATTVAPSVSATATGSSPTGSSPNGITPTYSALTRTVLNLNHPLFGVVDDWELFARGPTTVVRIEPARGRITLTSVPALDSTGPVGFLVGSRAALVRPIDGVPGYLVPDEGPVAQLKGVFAGGVVLPGTDPDHVWVEQATNSDATPATMELVDLNGQPSEFVRLPRDLVGVVASDGSGYLMIATRRGVVDLRPDGAQPVLTRGEVLADGAGRWLVADCIQGRHCTARVVSSGPGSPGTPGSRRGPSGPGASRVLGTLAVDAFPPVGPISPDGRTAVAFSEAVSGLAVARLVDLSTGRTRVVPVDIDPALAQDSGVAVFSPDSRWLFLVDVDSQVVAVDVADATVHGLGAALPNIYQVAVRD